MKRELKRKSIHLIGLAVPLIYYFTKSKLLALAIIGSATAIALLIELFKVYLPDFRRSFLRFLAPVLRAHERRGRFTGATYYLIGSFLSLLLFERKLAIACMGFLILGDLFAAVIGKRWGRIKLFRRKSLEGSLACFAVCIAIALLVGISPMVALAGAVVATAVELVPIGVDDNLTIPIISGIVMQFILSTLR